MCLKIIFIITLFIGVLQADQGKISGYFDIATISADQEYSDGTIMEDKSGSRIDIVVNYDKIIGKDKFTLSQGYFRSPKMYNILYGDRLKPISMYYINELSYEKVIFDNLSITGGVLPFKNGTFQEHSFTGDISGNGLMLSGYQNVNGLFLSYKYKNFLNIIGYSVKDLLIQTEYNLNGSSPVVTTSSGSYDYKGSGGVFLISKYNEGKHTVELNYFNVDIQINDNKLVNNSLYGIGYSWDDTEYTGNLFYGILMYSRVKGNSKSLNDGNEYIRDDIHFGPINTTGYQYLLGYKYIHDLDWFKREVFFNVEYVKTEPGFLSLSVGKPFSAYSSGALGVIYNFSVGVNYDKHLTFKGRYCMYKSDGNRVATGGVSESVPLEPGDLKKSSCLSLQMIYSF